MRAGIAWFQFGAAASTPMSESYLHFCERTLRAIASDEIDLLVSAPRQSEAFSLDQIIEGDSVVYHGAISWINPWIAEADLILVDVNKPLDVVMPGKAEVHLATALNYLHNDSVYNDSVGGVRKLFILLYREIPDAKDPVLHAMRDIAEAGNLIIISDIGEVITSRHDVRLVADEYKLARAAIRGNNSDLLRARMVRRRGHFHDNSGGLQTYFFDGQSCERELYRLIEEFVASEYDSDRPTMFYHCTVSTWLRDPVVAAACELGTEVFSAQDLLDGSYCPEEDRLDNVFVIVPRVETATTIERIISEITRRAQNCRLRVLAVISTQKSSLPYRETRVGDQTYRIDYFLRDNQTPVKQPISAEAPLCPLCANNPPMMLTSHAGDEHATLSSFAFYKLASESGWIEETDVPPGREPIILVPDFPSILRENGAFIASKLLDLLRFHVGDNFPAQPFLIVYPDQTGAVALASYLKVLHDSVTLVQIPNDVLGRGKSSPVDIATDESASWFRQLYSAAPSQQVVLMEEFVKTGGTKDTLALLVRECGRQISCHVAIADFSAEGGLSKQIPTHALYRIPLP